jgi:hypothetical protein
VVSLPELNHDVVDVDLDDLSDEVIKAMLHAVLVCQPGILQAEGHHHIVVRVEWTNE